ncbi:hypothetical protein OE165_28680, partial [Escherichia coli]|uniref:hypothetical protein n=1 Tax=Escherichia coli TaxID=562 RepID=UPI0021F36A38
LIGAVLDVDRILELGERQRRRHRVVVLHSRPRRTRRVRNGGALARQHLGCGRRAELAQRMHRVAEIVSPRGDTTAQM